MTGCVFCEIVSGRAPATILDETPDSLVIVTNRPVVDGHVIVIPHTHVQDAFEAPEVTGRVARDAAAYARDRHISANLITSVGATATQSVFHLHTHVVPRSPRDGLALPWTQRGSDRA